MLTPVKGTMSASVAERTPDLVALDEARALPLNSIQAASKKEKIKQQRTLLAVLSKSIVGTLASSFT